MFSLSFCLKVVRVFDQEILFFFFWNNIRFDVHKLKKKTNHIYVINSTKFSVNPWFNLSRCNFCQNTVLSFILSWWFNNVRESVNDWCFIVYTMAIHKVSSHMKMMNHWIHSVHECALYQADRLLCRCSLFLIAFILWMQYMFNRRIIIYSYGCNILKLSVASK